MSPQLEFKPLRHPDLGVRMAGRLVRAESGCLEWTGAKNHFGYGLLTVNGKRHVAHRVAWHLATGDPLDMREIVRHYVCDNPPCTEVAHLRKGTVADNSADMVRNGRSVRGERASRGRLNRHQVREIRRLLEAGERQSTIAEAFGVYQGTISQIKMRRSWAWLDE